ASQQPEIERLAADEPADGDLDTLGRRGVHFQVACSDADAVGQFDHRCNLVEGRSVVHERPRRAPLANGRLAPGAPLPLEVRPVPDVEPTVAERNSHADGAGDELDAREIQRNRLRPIRWRLKFENEMPARALRQLLTLLESQAVLFLLAN